MLVSCSAPAASSVGKSVFSRVFFSRMTAAAWLAGIAAGAFLGLSAIADPALAQGAEPMLPGEAYTTRFSGTIEVEVEDDDGDPISVIDPDGIVGSIIDIRAPNHAPRGEHWLTEPQRAPLTAGEVGQIFGIAIDDWDPANIYVAATSAFGLHLTEDGQWMPGMWGPEGGPGTVYKLNGENGYLPEVFADITLDGRPNSGAGLGNIAYDKWHEQIFVSDLETGMIHRIDTETGEDLGLYDHGIDGRSAFIDGETGDFGALPVIEFDPASAAALEDCPEDFSQTPQCWNIADYRRRVWGLGVFAAHEGDVRLYYAVWSADPFDAEDWVDTPEDQQNSVWSIGINDDGSFNIQDVRREFVLPTFDHLGTVTGTAVSDIAFSEDGTMLIAERGGLRNLGLGEDQSFAAPHVSRVLQYKLRQTGNWEPIARFDVGFYDRVNDGAPYLRANAAGGVDFGYGYTAKGIINPGRPDRMMWATGDYLCSPQGPCNDPEAGPRQDIDQVHGLQGTPRNADSTIMPEGALDEYPGEGDPYPASGPSNSYFIDIDFNIDGFGRIIEEEAERDDASRTGDIEVLRAGKAEPPVPLHAKQLSAFHNKYQSNVHDKVKSLPIHTKAKSHSKAQSTAHVKPWSHHKPGSHKKAKSLLHVKPYSHFKPKSIVHVKPWSHHKPGSHKKAKSLLHVKPYSHFKPKSIVHVKPWSHHKPGSHKKAKSLLHVKPHSHFKPKSVQHVKPWSHHKPGSHKKAKSLLHVKPFSHYKPKSGGKHVKPWSHHKPGSHKKAKSLLHVKPHSHFKPKSVIKQPQGKHVKPWSHHKPGSHKKAKSALHVKPHSHFNPKSVVKQPQGKHVKPWSHHKPGSHKKAKSALHVKPHSHFKPKSVVKQPQQPQNQHVKPWSHNKPGSHKKAKSALHVKPHSHFKPKSLPKAPAPACTGGQVLKNNVCACPKAKPFLVNGRCRKNKRNQQPRYNR